MKKSSILQISSNLFYQFQCIYTYIYIYVYILFITYKYVSVYQFTISGLLPKAVFFLSQSNPLVKISSSHHTNPSMSCCMSLPLEVEVGASFEAHMSCKVDNEKSGTAWKWMERGYISWNTGTQIIYLPFILFKK